ncbi:hypothetical protein TURU_096717 [Turdus rufiventris]|nr:hypothetical protein TURU_096717 [Turdus rufiventris]
MGSAVRRCPGQPERRIIDTREYGPGSLIRIPACVRYYNFEIKDLSGKDVGKRLTQNPGKSLPALRAVSPSLQFRPQPAGALVARVR